MGALIVSLLFLSNILDGFQALDDAGRPLPNAALTFLRSGTTIPKPVYADQELTQQLNDAQGRLASDSLGRFPLIYLADVTQPPYRVQLHTAQGVLRWDVDPYVCDCTSPPYLFRGPKHQALDDDGGTYPGATLRFTLPETETPVDVYADAGKRFPLANPLTADAGGAFPPVYLDDATEYRVRLADGQGNELLDVDPYVCQCGFLLLTSRPYPIESIESLVSTAPAFEQVPTAVFAEGVLSVAVLVEGSLREPLVTYSDWPPDAIESTAALIEGSLREPLVTYGDWPPESIESTATLVEGEVRTTAVSYSAWPAESIESTAALISGSLT